MTCMLNSKAYLFIIAVSPQFIKSAYGPIWSQATLTGILTSLMQLSIYDGLAVSAGKSRDLVIANPKVTLQLGPAVGHAFVIAAGFTAWHGLQL